MSTCEAGQGEWTIDDYIAFYDTIPEEKWMTGDFCDGYGRCCALGHLGFSHSPPDNTITERHAIFFKRHGLTLPMVNDGFVGPYNQPTPKQRVLAYLRDLKAKESAK